jgi:hypothetical protein
MKKQSGSCQPTGGSSTGAQLADASIEDGLLAEVQTTRAMDGQTPRILESDLNTISYDDVASVQPRLPGASTAAAATAALFDTAPFSAAKEEAAAEQLDSRKDAQFGRVVSHRYIVEQKIGSGAFGTIYKGFQLNFVT